MKKSLSLVLSCLLAMALLAGCGVASSASSSQPAPVAGSTPASSSMPVSALAEKPLADDVTIRLAGLTGPTAMGMAQLWRNAQNDLTTSSYAFTLAGSADEITPKLIQGELDIAAVPANLAAVLYNNTEGKVQLLAVNTLGVLYIVEQADTIRSMADLKGRTLYCTGKGSAPEYVLSYVLKENGLDPATDLTIEWLSEPTEAVATLQQNPDAVAMLPQPYVTVAQGQLQGLRVAIDMNQAWEDLDTGSAQVTGVLVVRAEFAQQHPEALAAFMAEYEASTQFVNENPAEAAAIIEEMGITKAAVAEKAIPQCNITYVAGSAMKPLVAGYLQVLFEQNEKAVGGKMPEANFYYGA